MSRVPMHVQRGDSIANTRNDISQVVAWTSGCGRLGSMITYVIAAMAATSGQRMQSAKTVVRSSRPCLADCAPNDVQHIPYVDSSISFAF